MPASDVRVTPALSGWSDETHSALLWLYDEFDLVTSDDVPEMFPESRHMWGPSSITFRPNSNHASCHRVLLSDGSVHVIPFLDVAIHHLPTSFLELR